MSYAAAQDVTDRLGRDVSGNTALITLITTRLSDVERLIKRRIPDLDAQLAADPPTIDVEDVKHMSAGSLEILPDEWEILGVSSSAMVIIAPKAVVHGCFPPHWWRWQQ
jgi:hypothetical protein